MLVLSFQILTINFRNNSHLMRKSCLKSAYNEDAHQSMHPVRTVGSEHATNKNIENELIQTWPRHSKDKCSHKV